MIYIASDHGGFKLKSALVKRFAKEGVVVNDCGPLRFKDGDDYPDYVIPVAAHVSAAPNKDFGILICRSGQGVCIAANKFSGVRAALAWSPEAAKWSRSDDHANILCIPADFVSESKAWKIVDAWLKEPWSKNARHKRRVAKIAAIEQDLRMHAIK